MSDQSSPVFDADKKPAGAYSPKKEGSDLEKAGGYDPTVHVEAVDVLAEQQEGGDIKYRTMSWQKCAALLFGEYVCLAILAFPYAFATLGMAGGILATLGLGVIALYTSMTLWRYCMKYPHLLHIADIGKHIFGDSWIAYELTAIALILNNCFIMGFHTLTGSEILNVLSEHGACTVGLSIAVMLLCLLVTLPRKLDQVAIMGIFSAISMAISILLVLIFTGVQGRNPVGPDPNGDVVSASNPVYITAFAPRGTTFVNGFNAFLNIVFTWVGQIMYPTFIAEMKNPEEFPKALYAVTAMEFSIFTLVGIVGYYYNGQFTNAPAVANLKPVFKKIAFSFVFPTTVIIGVIYGSVVSKYLFQRFFFGTRHYNNHTFIGWAGWVACVAGCWIFGWVIGEAVPFFGLLLSLMSALFDGFFGFIFWGACWIKLHKGELWRGQSVFRKAETCFNIFLIVCGFFILGPGLYSSVEAIKAQYANGAVKSPFTCADNSI